ncbi:hypothetical protein QQF64_003088 [Cirrhinus molitorella]|uniref:Orange domain-containing protein n=1 Tax=Cirrhinus molitorella TaxID=172907 RepID=A0ABR3MKC7_9TELE
MTPTIISKELLPLNNKPLMPMADQVCVTEIVHFLSKDEMKTQSRRRLLKHFQNLQTSCEQNRRESVLPDQKIFSKEIKVNKSAIWRPW